MKTFKQFLYEKQRSLVEELSKCQPFLNATGSSLYRGVELSTEAMYYTDEIDGVPIKWYISKSNKNRLPTDTPHYIHNAADRYFQNAFGWKARSAGVFATGAIGNAHQYGAAHLMFPIGNFKFIWSPNVEDLYHHYRGIVVAFERLERQEGISFGEDDILRTFEDKLHEAKYQDDNLPAAIKSRNEIMIDCDEYILVSLGVDHRAETNQNKIIHAIRKVI